MDRAASPSPQPQAGGRANPTPEAGPRALEVGGLQIPRAPWTSPWVLLHARPVRGQLSGPGGPHARFAGASLPGASSGPSQSAAAARHSRCWESLRPATWGLPSDRLWERAQKGSASVSPHACMGAGGGQHQTRGQGHRLVGLNLGESACLRPSTSPQQPHSLEEPHEHPLPCSWGD